jgi:hypothetical protein
MKQILGQRNDSLRRICLIHWASLQAQGYQLLQISPNFFRWNERTNVLNMTLEGHLSKGAMSTIVFCSKDMNSCFAVVLILMDDSTVWRQRDGFSLSTSVKVMPRPVGVPLRKWLETCETLRINWAMQSTLNKVDDHVEHFFQHPGETKSLNITATVAEERILNQDITVLDVTRK